MNHYNDHDTYYIFNLIGQYTELKLILEAVSKWLETRIPNALVTIMLYSKTRQTLELASGTQHFSSQYCNTVNNMEIGPHQGTCGAAAFLRKLVISDNLIDDPNWQAYKDIIKVEQLVSCWSIPIINATGDLYGTFATYYRTPTIPTEHHIRLLQQAAALVALAIELDDERQQKQAIYEKYSSFYNYHPDVIFEINQEGYIVSTNIASFNITGFSEQQVLGKHFNTFLPPDYHAFATTVHESALRGNAHHYEIPAYHSSGKIMWFDLTNLPIKQHQKVTGVFGIARDITQRRKNQENLRLLSSGVNASSNGIVITDASKEMIIVSVNPAFLRMTGYSEKEVIGQPRRFLQVPSTEIDKIKLINEAIQEKKQLQITLKNYRKDGSWFWARVAMAPIFDHEGNCTHFLGIQEDITQQRLHEEYIARQYSHDQLTGLPNRQTFEAALQQAFSASEHSPQSLTLLYIDLDDFQSMNDSLGHLMGDQIIKCVGDRLQGLLQPGDLLSRFNGDEFALLITDQNGSDPDRTKSNAIALAKQILDLFSQPFQVDSHKIYLSASIGIAANHHAIERSSELLHQANLAMKEAKRQGRNTWHWSEETIKKHGPEIDYAYLRLELMEALKQDQFSLFYQPLVDPATGIVKGVEALIRWFHPQRGYIFPDVFIPLAERTGQIIAIGQWVLKKACRDIAEWNRINQKHLTLSVNISPLQFRRAGFLQELEHALNVSQLPPELLKIEITEGMVIIGADRAIEILKTIRHLGVQVSIDDFGTGYSSLSYLRRLPINQIKLDRSFIENLSENEQDAAIVKSIIQLAHQLDLEVVAEGIETLQQARFLYQQGCNLLQGYYYARPAPLGELKSLYPLLLDET